MSQNIYWWSWRSEGCGGGGPLPVTHSSAALKGTLLSFPEDFLDEGRPAAAWTICRKRQPYYHARVTEWISAAAQSAAWGIRPASGYEGSNQAPPYAYRNQVLCWVIWWDLCPISDWRQWWVLLPGTVHLSKSIIFTSCIPLGARSVHADSVFSTQQPAGWT